MDAKEAKFLKTDRKPGPIDVHPTMDALVLTYDVHVTIMGGNDAPLYSEQKTLKKTIELPMINSRTDCHSMAKEVINQCDLIHHSRIPEVEQIIYYLKKRKLHGPGKADSDRNGEVTSTEVNYNNLGDYIDLLYEGMSEKVKGAQMIQALARDPDNLEALAQNELLVSALGRVLREDWKRSISLTTHLVFAFFCFSVYSRFHQVILKCKVGSICMDVIDFELRRYDKWQAEMEGGDLPTDQPIVRKACPSSASLFDIPRSRIPEPVRPKSGHFPDLKKNTIYDEPPMTVSMESLEGLPTDQKVKRFKSLVKKQEHLLRVAYYLLLNIAEDETVEEKMSKRNIVGLLVKALERNNDDLLILVVTFLKKLSIMQCNKDAMASYNVIDKLPKILDSKCPDLVHLTLKLLYNLSFDEKLRGKIVKNCLIPKAVNFLADERHQEVVLKLLYHLSYDEASIRYFSDSVGFIIDMFLLNGSETDQIMIALCLNLAKHPEIAREMVGENTLHSLITRAFSSENPMLMKLIRNLSINNLSDFIAFVGDLAKGVVESRNMDFVTECVGTLSNIHLPDLDWMEIFKHFSMLEWVRGIISENNTDPELVLQVIVLLGTAAATDHNCAQLFCEHSLITALIDLLKTHQEDDEIVLQILYVFYVTMWTDPNLDYVISRTEVPAYLIDLMQDNNKHIRKICNLCLNIIAERDRAWAERIKIEKFRYYNAQWLQMVDSQQLEPDQEEEEEEELPPYLNTEYLSQAVVRPVTAVAKLDELDLLEDNEVDYDYFSSHPNGSGLDDYDLEDM